MTLSRTNTQEARRELGLDGPQGRRERASHAFRVITAYWRSSEWLLAWTLLALNLGINFFGVGMAVSLSDWQRRLFDAVQLHDTTPLPGMMLELAWLIAAVSLMPLVAEFLTYYLKMRWRLWLTRDYMDRWLANHRYQEVERLRVIDNPDQRIAEDTRLVAEDMLALFTSVMNSMSQAVAFSVILYGLSAPIRLMMFGVRVAIPGDMLIYAILAAAIGTWLITIIGRPLVRRTMRQQHLDADLRFGLGNIRRHAEQIAFSNAAPSEHRALVEVIGNIRRNYMGYIFANLGLMAGQNVYMRLVGILPLLLALPRYMAGRMTLGQYTQAAQVFATVANSLSVLVQVYGGIAGQIAAVNRLKALDDSLANPRPRRIAVARTDDGTIRADDLALQLPNGRTLLSVPQWQVGAGERWTIAGSSGSGKSTLLRALAGLWPDGTGTVALPGDGLIMFVPQRLYLPIGQLKGAISFPTPAEAIEDACVLDLLTLCRLGHLADKLHVADVWQDRLSPGEQQRLALVRVLLHRPDYLLLDESTSALDEDNAAHFYRTLTATLPDAAIVSITHASALERYHDHALRIADGAATTVAPNRNATA
jgi:putative ATP-binding cassette transporter